MEFYAKLQGKIDFETLQAMRDPGLSPVLVRKGSILHLIDLEKSEWASSLKFAMRMKYDKDYSSEDISFLLMNEFREEDIPNRKINSPHMKQPVIHEELSWEKCLKEPTWCPKDTWMECNK